MTEIITENTISSVWPEWQLENTLGSGSFGCVYKAVRKDHGIESRSAIKVVNISCDDVNNELFWEKTYDTDHTATLIRSLVDDFINEIRVMQSIKGARNVVSIEDYKLVESDDGTWFRVFIRMELLTPLVSYISDKKLSENEVIKMGVDICNALDACAHKGIVHRDIKPENLFVNEFGDFKLGDFGIAKPLRNSTNSSMLPGTINYMAPEVFRNESYGQTADIYSLGLVLYRFMNKGRMPFLDMEKQILTKVERENSNRRRIAGEILPKPCEASDEFAGIILKACAPEAADRYQSAEEMLKALYYLAMNSLNGNIFHMEKEISEAAKKLHLSSKGTASFRNKVLKDITQRNAGNPEIDSDILKESIDRVSSVYKKWAEEHDLHLK